MSNRFSAQDIDEFIVLYQPEDRLTRNETWSSKSQNGRWRAFSIESLLDQRDVNLDLTWVKPELIAGSEMDVASLVSSIVADLQIALNSAMDLEQGAEPD